VREFKVILPKRKLLDLRKQLETANLPIAQFLIDSGNRLAKYPVSRNAASAGRWIYVRPIFERSTTNPWSSRVVGTLIVHSSADDADCLFKADEFHDMVDSVASEVSPNLDAIQVLVGEEKL